MSRVRVGLNGLGRIGRAIFRINRQRNTFDVVAINDINPDIANLAYLLQYDTTYGRFDERVAVDEESLQVGDVKIPVFHKEKIRNVPWGDLEVDVVIDSSGVKSNLPQLSSLPSSVKNIVITNAPRGEIDFKTIIFGVNEEELDPGRQRVISSSICDTIALTPILKALTSSHGIESGFLTTLHPWLSYQNLLDGPSVSWSQPGDIFSHYALGRGSTENVIPKSTSAINAAECVFPNLGKRIQSFSYRVPTSIVCSAVLILLLDRDIERDELVDRFENLEAATSHKVIRNSVEPLTSIDYRGEECSSVIDHRWTKVEQGRHLKLVYWYDNEWGYSNRVVDLIESIAEFHG